jgi:formate--tetrahydrofolate ligase
VPDLRPISDVAADLGLGPDLAEPHGRYRAKISLDALEPPPGSTRGRYVLVTAITPTGAGEGKTVTSVGLVEGLWRRGVRAVAALRQSSVGPTFGGKGGGAGGGRAAVAPLEESLLGLAHDFFAVEAAHNLLAAVADDAVHRGMIDASGVTWRRVVDVDDRALRDVVVGLGTGNGPPRQTGFDITAASEVMAILTLSRDLADLRERLGRVVVGFRRDASPVTAEELEVAGAMAALLRHATQPNLLQTADGTPVLLHAGPFANIAPGNSSVMADLVALPRAEVVVTEGGFAADLGAEKFLDLKCPASGLEPDCAVLVATVRALQRHAGPDATGPGGVHDGAANLRRHVANLRSYGLPVVVAVNRFPSDTPEELAALAEEALAAGAVAVAAHTAYTDGGDGALELADAVMAACEGPVSLQRPYALDDPAEVKVARLASGIYGAGAVAWEPAAVRQLRRFEKAGYGGLPICIAKTNMSITHDPTILGAPEGWTFPVREVRLAAGAGYLTVLAGDMMTMPGLPPDARYRHIDVAPDGSVVGLV